MSDPANIAARVARDLAEVNAALVSYSATGIVVTSDGTERELIRMVRKWPRIDDGLRANYENYLRAQEYVTDPMADREKRLGRWRVLRVYSSPIDAGEDDQGVYQTLIYWPVGYGDFGTYCGESSPLAHTDVQVFQDSPSMADCTHKIKVGSVFSASNRLDPETGLWSGTKSEDISCNYGSAFSSVSGTALQTQTQTEQKNADAPPTPGAAPRGEAYRVDWGINRYGKIDWSRTDLKGFASSILEMTTGGVLVEAVRREQRNAADVPTVGRGEAGYLKSGNFSINELSLIDWSDTVEHGIELLGTPTHYGGKYETTLHEEGRNSLSPKDGVGTGNNFTRGSYSINQYGTYDWSLDTVTPVLTAQPVETKYGSQLVETMRKANKNQSAPANVGVGAIGEETGVSFSINEFGLIDWTTTKDVAKASAIATTVFGGPLATTTHQEQRNARAVQSPGAGEVGQITRSQFSINNYSLFDWSTDVVVATPAGVINTETSKFRTTTTLRFYNKTDIPAYPAITGVGTPIQNASISINEFGLYDGTLQVTVGISEDTGILDAGGDATKTVQIQLLYNQPSFSVPPQTGKVVSASASLNENGAFDSRVAVVSPVRGIDSGWVAYQDRYGTSYVRSFQNMPTPPADGFTDDTSNSLSIRKNEFGLWDGSATRSAIRDTKGGGSPADDVELNYTIVINERAFTIAEKITSSLTRAQSFISKPGTSNKLGSGKQPGIVYLGRGKYKATRVT